MEQPFRIRSVFGSRPLGASHRRRSGADLFVQRDPAARLRQAA